jgi:hypothetical protein
MARKATKALEEQGYSKLDAYCIGMYEFAQSLKRAGFDEETVLGIIVERSAYPAWILPDPIEPERFGDYEDDEDDD